jgi:hypothetical protein
MLSFFAFAYLVLITVCVGAENAFLFPTAGGNNITLNSIILVNWTTDWGSVPVKLTVFQINPGNGWKFETLLGRSQANVILYSLTKSVDNVVDPASYKWTAQPLDGLSITNGFHFNLARSAAVEAGSTNANDSFSSGPGPLYIVDVSTINISAPSESQESHVTSLSFPYVWPIPADSVADCCFHEPFLDHRCKSARKFHAPR